MHILYLTKFIVFDKVQLDGLFVSTLFDMFDVKMHHKFTKQNVFSSAIIFCNQILLNAS